MKVATILLKYDYGLEERGESLEKKAFFPAIKENADEVAEFWLEENGYPNDIDGLQNKIIKFCKEENPDIVFFILMKDEIRIETIEKLTKDYITINWFCDDQWRFKSFTKYLAPALTTSITMDKYSLEQYKQLGCKVIHSQWAALDYLEDINIYSADYKYDISFIGGKNITREWYIYELKKAGYRVECFGNGWGNGRISYEEMKDIFFNSKINLNLSNSVPSDIKFYIYIFKSLFFYEKNKSLKSNLKKIKNKLNLLLRFGKNKKNIEQMKARNFEIPGYGGFQLSQYCLELEDYYDIGKEVAIFSTIEELKLNIDYYLNNNQIRESMKKKIYLKTKQHTYRNRIKNIIDEVKI